MSQLPLTTNAALTSSDDAVPVRKLRPPVNVLKVEYDNLTSTKDNKAVIAASPLAIEHKGFKTPKEVIAAMIIIGEAKLDLKIKKILVLAFFGGVYSGFGGICAAVALTGLPGFNENFPAIPKFLYALIWPVGLTYTVVCGAELYMGNCLTCTVAWCHAIMKKKNTRYCYLLPINLLIVLLMNSLGAMAASFFFGYLTEIFAEEPYLAGVQSIAGSKLAYGWHAAFLRGIACNQVVCLGIFMSVAAEDVFSKVISCYIAIFTFVFSGYDGSISNMVIVPLSIMYGSPVTFAEFMWRSFLPSALGNLVGGFILVAMLYYWAYYLKKEKRV